MERVVSLIVIGLVAGCVPDLPPLMCLRDSDCESTERCQANACVARSPTRTTTDSGAAGADLGVTADAAAADVDAGTPPVDGSAGDSGVPLDVGGLDSTVEDIGGAPSDSGDFLDAAMIVDSGWSALFCPDSGAPDARPAADAGTLVPVDGGFGPGPVLFLSDRTSGSETHTNELEVDARIERDADAVRWLISEDPNALDSNPAWRSSEPSTVTLTAGRPGPHAVYVWVQDAMGTVTSGAAPAEIEFDDAPPTLPPLEWRGELPRPTGNDLLDVVAVGDDVYAVGEAGTILRRCGAGAWCQEHSGTDRDLRGVAGNQAFGFFAAGRDVVLHSEGDGVWTRLPDTGELTLTDVWVQNDGTVYVVAGEAQGAILRWSGSAWTVEYDRGSVAPSVSFHRVVGNDGGEVFAVGAGDGGVVFQSSGDGVWSEVSARIPTGGGLRALWAAPSGDTYASGWQGTLLHRAPGTSVWSSVSSNTEAQIYGLVADASARMYAVGASATWQEDDVVLSRGPSASARWHLRAIDLQGVFRALTITDHGTLYAVGSKGAVLRSEDGVVWSREYTTNEPIIGLWGTGPTEVFALMDRGPPSPRVPGQVLRSRSEGEWQALTLPDSDEVGGLWASSPSNIYVVGGPKIRRFDGATWVDESPLALGD